MTNTGRNWTRRSIEELIDYVMRKAGYKKGGGGGGGGGGDEENGAKPINFADFASDKYLSLPRNFVTAGGYNDIRNYYSIVSPSSCGTYKEWGKPATEAIRLSFQFDASSDWDSGDNELQKAFEKALDIEMYICGFFTKYDQYVLDGSSANSFNEGATKTKSYLSSGMYYRFTVTKYSFIYLSTVQYQPSRESTEKKWLRVKIPENYEFVLTTSWGLEWGLSFLFNTKYSSTNNPAQFDVSRLVHPDIEGTMKLFKAICDKVRASEYASFDYQYITFIEFNDIDLYPDVSDVRYLGLQETTKIGEIELTEEDLA